MLRRRGDVRSVADYIIPSLFLLLSSAAIKKLSQKQIKQKQNLAHSSYRTILYYHPFFRESSQDLRRSSQETIKAYQLYKSEQRTAVPLQQHTANLHQNIQSASPLILPKYIKSATFFSTGKLYSAIPAAPYYGFPPAKSVCISKYHLEIYS